MSSELTGAKDVLTVEQWPLERIKPYESNPRVNDGAVDAVAESIKRFGFRVPIIVDAEGIIVAGHTRLKAAAKLGLAHAPVHQASDLSEDETRALRIADNKSGEIAEWDFELLPIELSALQELDWDLTALGFAAERTGRVCVGTELEPRYCDVIRKRWSDHVYGEGCDWQALTPAGEGKDGA